MWGELMATWRDTASASWRGWFEAISFPLFLPLILVQLPVERMILTESWNVLLILLALLFVVGLFWLKGILITRNTAYKISIHSDGKVKLFLHYNREIDVSKEDIVYVTPYVPLSIEEVMTETAKTRDKKYVVRLINGQEYRIRYTMNELEELLKSLSGEMIVNEAEATNRDEEVKELIGNNFIYAISYIVGLVLVGGTLAFTLLPFIEANYGKENAAAFTAFVWLPIVIVVGPLVGMLIGYFVVRFRSGKDKAVEGLIGKNKL